MWTKSDREYRPTPPDAQAAAAVQRDDSSLLPAPVALQVQRLIVNATLSENLAQAFSGWCGTW